MLNSLIEEQKVVNAFNKYLKERKIKIDEIIAQDVDDFNISYYWEIFDESDSIEEIEETQDKIAEIIYKNFKINESYNIFNANGKCCATCRTLEQAQDKIKELIKIDVKLAKDYNNNDYLTTYSIKKM